MRRTIGLWLSPVAVVAACLVIGPAMMAAALGVAVACALARHGVRAITRRDGVHAREGGRFIAPVAGLCWGLAGAASVAAPDGLRAERVLHELRRVSAGVALGHPHGAASWATVIDLLVGGAPSSSLFLARGLRCPDAVRGESSQAALDRARAIVAEHGDDSLSPYILRPDKEFQFAEDSVVAFAVIGDTVVISGDPVGPPDEAAEALRALVGRARQAGLRVAAYGVSERHLEAFRALGLHAVRAGEEAVVDPRAFTLEGRPCASCGSRSIASNGTAGGRMREGREIDVELEAEIDAVESRVARAARAHSRLRHEHGRVRISAIRADDLYVLAFRRRGSFRAVMRFLAHQRKLSLDIMRRVGQLPNGLIEALVCHALQFARAQQVKEVSLNYAGLAHLLRPDASGRRCGKALAQRLLRPLRSRFQMDRLVLFNEKFSPMLAVALPRVRLAHGPAARDPPRAAGRGLHPPHGVVATRRIGAPRRALPASGTYRGAASADEAAGGTAGTVVVAAAVLAAGLAGAYSYAQDYSLHRGFRRSCSSAGLDAAASWCPRSYSQALRRRADYLVYLPPNYSPQRRYSRVLPASRGARSAAGVRRHRQHGRPA